MKRALCALLVSVALIAACGDDDDDTTSATSATTAAGASGDATTAASGAGGEGSGEPIIIGAAVAQSGGFELYDNEVLTGIRYQMEKVNATGGIAGRQVELVVADHKTDVAQVESATRQVLDQGADLVVTTADYDFGAQAALVAGQANVVSMGGAGAPEFGKEGLGPLHFNVYQGTPTEAAVMAEWGFNDKQWKRPYLLADTSIEYSKSVCDLFEQAWTDVAGPDSIAGKSTFLSSDPSIASQVSAINGASDADVLVLCSYPPGGASAIRQVRTGGIDLPILGVAAYDGTFWLEAVPDLSDFYYPTMVSSAGDDPSAAVNEFLAAAKPAGGAIYALFGYEIVETLKIGVEKAGTTEGKALAAAIETFTDEPFLVGPTSYTTECHIPLGRNMAMLEIQGGTPKFLEYVTPKALPESPC
jgi:branched-chain amino acid transport system substrate-binding protein